MRILILGINYAPEIISTAVYTTGLAEYLAEQGHHVKVISALPYFPSWRVFEGWRGFSWRNENSKNNLEITHCPLYVPNSPTGPKRVFHHLTFAFFAAPVAIWFGFRRQPDLVFVVAPSMISAPIGIISARLARAKTWLHIQDYEVEAAFATGLLKEGGIVGRLALAFEKWILGKFDRISSISRPMLKKAHQKGVPVEKIREFRNWTNLRSVKPNAKPSEYRGEFNIETRFVALYSGNLANKQGLEILPEIARILESRSDLTIVVCGDGPMRSALADASTGLTNIRFFPLQPIDRLGELLSLADVHLLPQIKGAADLVLPSKLTNMLASGRPVVATADADTALGEEMHGVGFLVPPGDAVAAAEALITLLDDEELRRTLGHEARKRAEKRWDMSEILSGLLKEFAALKNAKFER